MAQEQRRALRRRVLKIGSIVVGGGAIDCTVRNLSRAGAALEVASPIGIPDTFTLIVPSEGIREDCKVVWRKEKRIGISFRA